MYDVLGRANQSSESYPEMDMPWSASLPISPPLRAQEKAFKRYLLSATIFKYTRIYNARGTYY